MRVIAIDPGNEFSALVVWDGEHVEFKLYAPNEEIRNWLKSCSAAAFAVRAGWVNAGGMSVPSLVIEMIGHYGLGMPAGKTVFDTCVWIGRFTECYGSELTETILRPTVKTHLCGSARAKDGNVIQALKDRFGDKGTKGNPGVAYGMSGDLWQAWAVAVTWLDGQKCVNSEVSN